MTIPSSDNPENAHTAEAAPPREGDPLDGLWHWTDHPLARTGMVIAVLLGLLILFPLLAQITF
jgi:hypothetical protein